ncbi:hypothetical protein NL404_27000, partial [Klebsiella pneumoniae]|nr:hypothetical protein [Klebsiella pneumoniae]
ISEGFVRAKEGKSLEGEAQGYLNELVERSLVSTEIIDGTVRGCKVHDLMHEFIMSKVKDLCFCQILSEKNTDFGENKHRRLSIHKGMPKTAIGA